MNVGTKGPMWTAYERLGCMVVQVIICKNVEQNIKSYQNDSLSHVLFPFSCLNFIGMCAHVCIAQRGLKVNVSWEIFVGIYIWIWISTTLDYELEKMGMRKETK